MLGWHCLNKWDFVRKFKIDVDVLKGWLELVEESYEDTAYHNCEHLVVSLSCHTLAEALEHFLWECRPHIFQQVTPLGPCLRNGLFVRMSL